MSSSAALIVPPSTSATRGLVVSPPLSACRARWSPSTSYVATRAAVEEGGGGGDGLGDQAAGVAAQVEDDPGAGGHPGHGIADLRADALGEGGDLDDGEAVGGRADGHGVRGQPGAAHGLGPRARAALQAQPDGGAGGLRLGVAAQYGDDLGDGPPVDPLAVYAAQPVALADPGVRGG
ncbi:hypothetical protein RKD37_005587 [Streptomyces ambofaciens]